MHNLWHKAIGNTASVAICRSHQRLVSSDESNENDLYEISSKQANFEDNCDYYVQWIEIFQLIFAYRHIEPMVLERVSVNLIGQLKLCGGDYI